MPKDHYVAQTYLRSFTNKDGWLIPYYKGQRIIVGKAKSTKSVCCADNGSTTKYLVEPRILENFLKPIETNWPANVQAIKSGRYNIEIRQEVAAYLACLRLCTPTATRKGCSSLAAIVRMTTKQLADQGKLNHPDFSPEFNQQMLHHLYQNELSYEVDSQYALARAVLCIPNLIKMYLHADWKILLHDGGNFLTSDNPLCLYYPNNNPQYAWTYAPLTTDMAVLIRPDLNFRYERATERQVTLGRIEYGRIKENYLHDFNQNLVRSAEKSIFFSRKEKWIELLVKKNSNWATESLNEEVPLGSGRLLISRDRPRERTGP
jgi:hypothetical protein